MPTSIRQAATETPLATGPDRGAHKALDMMIDALKLIDSSEGANVASAHLDLAIHRLQEWIERDASK